MPRVEDIAWKFVIRQDKKWRCPYCETVYSGSVTRVRSHFLKQPKEGIASCTKVPEHISTLMELLHKNQVRNKADIAWKFVERLGDGKWSCHHCREEFFGDLTGVRGHLLGVPNEGISICTQMPDHVRKLMQSLLDEVAEEQSRDAHGPSSMEPQSRDMLTRAEVAEDESREENRQFFREPESRDILPPGIPRSSQSFEDMENLFPTPRGATHMANLTSDQDRQFQETLAMLSLAQSGHDESMSCSTMALTEEERRGANGQSSTEPQSRQMPAQAEVDQVVAEEESREAYCQFSMEPQSRDMSTQAEVNEESREAYGQICPEQLGHLLSEESVQQMIQELVTETSIQVNSDQQPQAERPFPQSSTMPLLVQSSPVQPALVPPPHQSVLHQSVNHETRDTQQNATMPLDNLDTNQQPDLHDYSAENPVEPFDATVNLPEVTQTNEVLNPTVGSSLQNELSLHVDRMNRSEDCSQPCVVEGVPILSDTSLANTVQHPDQLPPRCDKEDGNDTRLFPSPTQMDTDPPIAPPYSSDSPIIEATTVNSQVPVVATNSTGPSSSQDMNGGSLNMNVRSIYANDKEIRNLKRKVEELDDKEADIKEQMDMESAASSVRKKPRKLVERWLEKTESARNNFQIIGQANAETLHPKEQVETLTREVEELIEKTLPQPLLIEERNAKGVVPQTLLIEDRDAKGVAFLERKLIGEAIQRNIKLIWNHLKENRVRKLGIQGMGGVGKTTIMMHIHNRLLKDAAFDGVVFITMSQDFCIYKLQSDIWKALKVDVMEDVIWKVLNNGDEKKRAAMLSKQLERKKNCVLILDDMWKFLDLEEVGIPVKADGFKLVLTTRSSDVCCQMQCQEKIKIEPLSQEEAKNLFLEELGSEVALHSDIKAIVNSIVKECAGLPIGVITMARSMRGVTDAFEWRDSLVKLKESSMGQTEMEKVLMNLKFSYDRLGDPDVQQCFLSCALYPEDELVDKFELVEFFIDQGLISESGLNTRKEQYDRGLTILNRLGNVCLLEDHGKKMKMHDLIRDMALHIMSATSIVKPRKGLTRIPPEECWTEALEKVSLMENDISEFPLDMSPNCPRLSTLLLNYNTMVIIPDSFFRQFCGLKVLNLSGCYLRELPNSISNLVNLRALLLSHCLDLRRIPYLGKLTSLRKLDIDRCDRLEVPEGLGMLMNLRYLALGFLNRGRLPKGVLGGLLNMQHLKVGFPDGEDITKLRALGTLECYFEDADDFNKCVRFVIEQGKLQYYYLCMNGLLDDSMGVLFDSDGFGKPKRRVSILRWSHAIMSMGGECTGNFILIPRDVQMLVGKKCDGVKNLSGIGSLEYLEELIIEKCEKLEVLCGGKDEVINIRDSPAPTLTPLLFPNLRSLDISYCPKLKYLFGHGSISNHPHLRKIKIMDCEDMVGITAAVTSPPPHPLPAFPSLEEISIIRCHKMKRVVESEWMPHFPKLRIMEVYFCEKMEEIIGDPPPHASVEKISLESLSASYCDNMRKLLSQELLLHLRNLQKIWVENCKGMVEMISGAGQGQEGSMMTPVNNTPSSFQSSISLPNLKQLSLYDLTQLKSICGVPISCGSMEELDVLGCPELKAIPLQLRLRDIDNEEELPHIWVEDEEKWKTLMWDDPNAQAILQPYLRKEEFAIG
ncbi:hypothetical protein BT93_F1074 [Corymbia citriodora subsp. variegata]|nr:hypothetical protein BT93_F1074 [Corymbia citriodora subsp. variegata]